PGTRTAKPDVARAATRRDGADQGTGRAVEHVDRAVGQRTDVHLSVIGCDGDVERVATDGRANRILERLRVSGCQVPHEQLAVLDVGREQSRAVGRYGHVLNVRAAGRERLHDLLAPHVDGDDRPLVPLAAVHTGRNRVYSEADEDRAG